MHLIILALKLSLLSLASKICYLRHIIPAFRYLLIMCPLSKPLVKTYKSSLLKKTGEAHAHFFLIKILKFLLVRFLELYSISWPTLVYLYKKSKSIVSDLYLNLVIKYQYLHLLNILDFLKKSFMKGNYYLYQFSKARDPQGKIFSCFTFI